VGRADPLAEVIEAQRADVVALVEADDGEVVERIAKRLKMEVVRGEGNSHTAAFLSRHTIVESINHAALNAGLSNCFLEARIATGEMEIAIGVAQLDAMRDGGELEIVLREMEAYRTKREPHLLVGEFGVKPGRLFDAGYIDCLAVARPKEARAGATFSTLHPAQRVDYILACGFEPKSIKDAWIETDRLARYASDHFPVGAEIDT
jgi:endonuclease/exonuclease/phosphatase family metal-dependent hydrolase